MSLQTVLWICFGVFVFWVGYNLTKAQANFQAFWDGYNIGLKERENLRRIIDQHIQEGFDPDESESHDPKV